MTRKLLAVRIPETLARKTKALCASRGVSVQAVVEGLLEQWVSKRQLRDLRLKSYS